MPTFLAKDEAGLAYEECKKRLRLEAELVKQRLLNAALVELTAEFNEAMGRGELLRVNSPQARAYLGAATRVELGA